VYNFKIGGAMTVRSMFRILPLVGLLALFSCKTAETAHDLQESSDSGSEDEVLAKVNYLIEQYRSNVSADSRKAVRDRMWTHLNQAEDQGKLKSLLLKLVSGLPQFKDASPEEKESTASLLYTTLKMELNHRSSFDSWEAVEKKLLANVTAGSSQDLISSLETIGRTDLIPVEKTRVLVNGTESWPLRIKHIQDAKKSIWIFCWAIYDDMTGNEMVDLLIAKKKKDPNVDMRIVVDGIVQSKTGYQKVAQRLIDAGVGIEFVRWSHPKLFGFGMHRKVMIFDHGMKESAAIFGGMNMGDNYSHRNPVLPAIEYWRDTDIIVFGDVVDQAAFQFATAWNNFVDEPGSLVSSPNLTKVKVPFLTLSAQTSDSMLAFIDQDPSLKLKDNGYIDPIYAVTLKMIDAAQKSVDISNAYYISTLPIENALKRASDRGVQVRVHSNSDASLTAEDKPLLGPIYGSLRKLLVDDGGNRGSRYKAPEVYLQKEHALHGKVLVVDGKFGWVGSYNIHPRSYRYESESVGMFYGAKIGADVQAMVDADIAKSEKAVAGKLELPANTLFDLLQFFFFEQL
jgi:cardiolipin synthase